MKIWTLQGNIIHLTLGQYKSKTYSLSVLKKLRTQKLPQKYINCINFTNMPSSNGFTLNEQLISSVLGIGFSK